VRAVVAVMSEAGDTAGLGHNRPPQPLDATLLLDWIEPDLEALRSRRAALLEAVERFKDGHVPIRDDDEQGNAAEFVRQLRAFVMACETLRREVGAPYLDCTSTLNSAFKRLEAPIITGREAVDEALTQYARLRAAEERERREAAALAKREAAALAERQARQSGAGDPAWDRAVDTAARSEKADRAASAGTAELSRVRGDMGATASLRERWDYEVTDPDAVPRLYLQINPMAIRAAITGGAREIAGLRIFDASKVAVR
jgi:hypothetical protein